MERTAGQEQNGHSLLSDIRILEHMRDGHIVITPFTPENLNTVSYDVTLGPNFYRPHLNNGIKIYNPWNESHVRKVWGEPQHAQTAEEVFENPLAEGCYPDDEVIVINPGELLLCHTQEFIGGVGIDTTMMKARSSVGRNGISVCKCAGWGDVGYINRWTMEIESHLPIPIALLVGRRIAQIAFFEVGVTKGSDYAKTGKYQTSSDIDELQKKWKPDDMIPKMWRDKEVRK